MVVFHAHQVLWQGLALGLAAWFNCGCGNFGQVLQRIQLGLQAGLVGGQGLFEQLALLGVHGFGAGGELPRLQAGQLEGDALERGGLELELSLAPGDELVARGDDLVLLGNVLALLTDARQHLLRQCGQFRRTEVTQSAQIVSRIVSMSLSFGALFTVACLQHVPIVQSQHWCGYPGRNGLRVLSQSRRNCSLVQP